MKKTGSASYVVDGFFEDKRTFTVWLVIFNTHTNQYVPLKQQNWTLDIDTGQPGPYVCEPQGSPAAPSSRPTDASTTSDAKAFARGEELTVEEKQ
jgi:hypothetical protein